MAARITNYPHKYNPKLKERDLTDLTLESVTAYFISADEAEIEKRGGRWEGYVFGTTKTSIGPIPEGTEISAKIHGDEVEFSYNPVEDSDEEEELEVEDWPKYTVHLRHMEPEIIFPKSKLT
jgi:hypothetical protein